MLPKNIEEQATWEKNVHGPDERIRRLIPQQGTNKALLRVRSETAQLLTRIPRRNKLIFLYHHLQLWMPT